MYLTTKQLRKIGFAEIGENVLISDKASIYNPGNITLGNDIRIDDFCILSAGQGGIDIHNYCHIACHATLIGKGHILLMDYTAISGGTKVYSSSDDYVGPNYIGVMVPEEFKKVNHGSVIMEIDTCVGAGSVVLPNVIIGARSRVGALSFVNRDIPEDEIWGGNPCKFLKSRSSK